MDDELVTDEETTHQDAEPTRRRGPDPTISVLAIAVVVVVGIIAWAVTASHDERSQVALTPTTSSSTPRSSATAPVAAVRSDLAVGTWAADLIDGLKTIASIAERARVAADTGNFTVMAAVCEDAIADVAGPRRAVSAIPDSELRSSGYRMIAATDASLRACADGDIDEAAFQARRSADYLRDMTARVHVLRLLNAK